MFKKSTFWLQAIVRVQSRQYIPESAFRSLINFNVRTGAKNFGAITISQNSLLVLYRNKAGNVSIVCYLVKDAKSGIVRVIDSDS